LLAGHAGVPVLAHHKVAAPAVTLRRDGCGTVPSAVQTKRLEVGRAVVVIAVMLVIARVATFADFFELAAALLGLAAALAVLVDGFLQILFRLADVTAALIITVSAGRRCHSGQ
jgi:hypothetical protein